MRTLLAVVMGLSLVGFAAAEDKKEVDLPTRLKALKIPAGKPFTLIVHLQVKKGQEKAMLEAAAPCLAATRKEAGCLTYELQQNLEHPSRFVFFERWQSVDALLEHLGAAHTRKLLGTVGKIADGPNRLDFYLNSDDR